MKITLRFVFSTGSLLGMRMSLFYRLPTLGICLSITWMLSSCASLENMQEEKFRSLKSSYKYKAYEKLSSKLIEPNLRQINSVVKNTRFQEISMQSQSKRNTLQNIERATAHAFASILLSLSMKFDLALAEGDFSRKYARESNTFVTDDEIAQSSLSVAMYHKGWNDLGDKYTLNHVALNETSDTVPVYKQLVGSLALGVAAIHKGEPGVAKQRFELLASLSGDTWLDEVASALADMNTGKNLTTLVSVSKIPPLVYQQLVELNRIKSKEIPLHEKAKQNQEYNLDQWLSERNALIKQLTIDSLRKVSDINVIAMLQCADSLTNSIASR